MTWGERALLITAVTVGLANLATALWTMLRACETYHMMKKRK
jgi:multisubunit Na+/H+ antiporter MnhC subunit